MRAKPVDGNLHALVWEAWHPKMEPDRLAAQVELEGPPSDQNLEAMLVHMVASAEKWIGS